MASRVRAMSAHSVSTVIWPFARRLLPLPFRFSGWLILDLLVVLGALYGATAIGGAGVMDSLAPLTVAVLLIGSAVIFSVQGLYLSVIRYMGQQAVWDLVKAVSLSTLALGAVMVFAKSTLPASAALVYWLLLLVGIGGLRLVSRGWLQANTWADARRVIIYGAGESGRQLLNALNHGTDYRVEAFIDDNPNLHETCAVTSLEDSRCI